MGAVEEPGVEMSEFDRNAYSVDRCIWHTHEGILRVVLRNVLDSRCVDVVQSRIFTQEEMLAATELYRSCNIPIEVTCEPFCATPMSPTRH